MSELPRFDIDDSGDYVALKEAIPPRRSVQGIGQVATTLYDVAEAAKDARLPNTHFAPVYARLSERIQNRLHTYSHPADLDKTAGIFLDAFLDPLRDFSEGVLEDDQDKLHHIQEHWQAAFFDPKVRKISPVAQFKIGMGAHIEGDLAPVLADSGVGDRYYSDYTHKVGADIRDTSYELASELIPMPAVLGRLALPFVNASIAKERQEAWVGSKKIMAARALEDTEGELAVVRQLEGRATKRIKYTRDAAYAGAVAIDAAKGIVFPGDNANQAA